ncbi:hypothetical protein NC981_00945 [Leptolyngbya sp. DQ-M1]|uniref:hypothetical protein n=1 Tax=Leptolyngbya sp. DQ-M1 TaxID=2933920 RepID=UPI003296E1B0
MPHPKRQSSTNRKRSTGRQIVLARRSRSVKASLLKALSFDLVTLYQAAQAKGSDNATARNSYHPMPGQSSNFREPVKIDPANRSIPPNLEIPGRPAERLIARSNEIDLRQVQSTNNHDDKAVPRSASEKSFAIVMVRCFAFLLGVLIRCVLIFYLQPFAMLLSGVAIAVSSMSLLMAVVFTPWKKKLLWNLACVFGGLLVAVLIL